VITPNESLAAFDAAEKRTLLDDFAALDVKPWASCPASRQIRRQIGELERGEQTSFGSSTCGAFRRRN